jgi:RNA polymerase sigma factor (sigma-70 family)
MPSDGAPLAALTALSTATDDELIAACRRGDAEAWGEIVRRYERLVLAIARGYGLDTHAAADVAQTSFTILVQSLDRLRPETRLAPWLATVARRQTWRAVHGRSREPVVEMVDRHVVSDRSAIDDRTDIAWLAGGLARLGSRCRQLLEALYLRVDEPSYAQISAELAMPIGSIGPTRARCLAKLRALLGGQSGEEPS